MSALSSEGSDPVRLALIGFGRVGRAVLELALARPWLAPVAIVARSDERAGEPASTTVAGAPDDLRVRTDAAAALADAAPDVVIVATRSRLADVAPQLAEAAGSGARAVISTAEELAYARPEDGAHAAAIHGLAVDHDVAIVASGVNPGFVLDLWPLVLSGLAWDVERVEARRVVDVSVFAPHTRVQLGIGHDEGSFAAGVRDGTIAGHLGFRESLRLLADAMGRPADRISVDTEPVFAEHAYRLADGGTVEAGRTIAAAQRAVAWRGEEAWISVEMLLHAAPDDDGVRPIDEARIHGRHALHATIEPGTAAILGTAAQLVNAIPAALRAAPGLYAPGQLAPGAPWLAATAPSGIQRAGATGAREGG